MIRINRHLDMIINSLKQCAELEKIRFVRGYSSQRVETPVSGFIAAVILKSVRLKEEYLGGDFSADEKGCLYSADAEIRLYAPKNENGSGLSELSAVLLDKLGDADLNRALTDFKAGQIEFDQNLNAVFRRIGFELELPALKEDGDE